MSVVLSRRGGRGNMAIAMVFLSKGPTADRYSGRTDMSFMSKAIVTAAISLAFIAPAAAQAPQAEKNVSMKMALMIIEGTLEQCAKDGYKVSITIVSRIHNGVRGRN